MKKAGREPGLSKLSLIRRAAAHPGLIEPPRLPGGACDDVDRAGDTRRLPDLLLALAWAEKRPFQALPEARLAVALGVARRP